MQHHSHAKCDDCGTRHTPGNSAECIGVLKELHSAAMQEIENRDREIITLIDERNELKERLEVRMETVLFSNRENKRLKELCAELVGPDMKREIE